MMKERFAIWSLVPLSFLNPTCTSGSSRFTHCWSLAGRILRIILLACELSATVWQFEHSLALPFFETGTKTDLFPSRGHCWVFWICWHIECSTFTASSFRIWNSSTGIPLPPLALFIVMFSKIHIILHSKMSGSGWVITSLWFSGSLRYFVYSSSVYSCHLFLISYASVRFISFLSFIVPIFAWNVPLISNFLEQTDSLSHSIAFLYFFALFTLKGFLSCPCCSLKLCIQISVSFLFSFVFHFSSVLSYL